MKKIITFFIVLSLLCMPFSSFADSQNISLSKLEKQQQELVEHLKSLKNKDSQSIENAIKNFSQENKSQNFNNVEISENENFFTLANNTKKHEIVISDNIVDNEDLKMYDIDSETKIIFPNDDEFFYVLENTPQEIASLETSTYSTKTSSSYESKTVDKTWTAYSWVGLKAFKVRLKGTFKYNGKKSNADISLGTFKPAKLSPWSVDSWSTGDKDYSDGDSKIFAHGSAVLNISLAKELGFEYNITSLDVEACITCDKDGLSTYVFSYEKDKD